MMIRIESGGGWGGGGGERERERELYQDSHRTPIACVCVCVCVCTNVGGDAHCIGHVTRTHALVTSHVHMHWSRHTYVSMRLIATDLLSSYT
jgi:hypothetical protein